MTETAADVLVEGIIRWGVDTIFGIPGDGINGIMEARRDSPRAGARSIFKQARAHRSSG
ncbi:MAG TPA: hypothetical protein VK619_09130 [Pyrinomonadaceae bacterium]|nr:hypothetical protein [Pyrinomonadaceae bacterium]